MPELINSISHTERELENFKKHYARFIERAAHDLQTPARKIAVLTERLVSKYQDQEEARPHIDRIHACMADMHALIEGFAELATSVSGNMDYASCDLSQFIEQGQFVLSENGDTNRFTQTDMPVIQGDKYQLRLLFKKIIDNSYHYRSKGIPLEIHISSAELDENEKLKWELDRERKYFRIDIKDNGIGLKEEDVEDIFKPLVRKHQKDGTRGSGLGLTIAKQIVENHKGIIFAVPEQEGSRFVLILPEKP